MLIKLMVSFLLMFSFVVYADIVKWVDENGQTHYSNKAPKESKKSSKKIKFETYKKPSKSTEITAVIVDKNPEIKPAKKILLRPVKTKKPTISELKVQCELAREERLAPVREEEIEECIDKNESRIKRPREYCERYHRYFGNGEIGRYGRTLRLFHNIPECRRLYRAEDRISKQRRGYSD